MKRAPLDDIALTTNTDKSSRFHDYCHIYDELFAPIRALPIHLLEIGILGGDSLCMWARYFFNCGSRITGVDIHDRGFTSEDQRIATIYGDAGQAMFLSTLPGPFDVICEDGSHFSSHQITAFEALWPMVKSGGYFISEDCHVVNSPQHRDMHIDILDFYNRLAHEMQDEEGATGSGCPDPLNRWHSIESITLRRGLAIVRKRG